MTQTVEAEADARNGDLPSSYALHTDRMFDGYSVSGPATVHVRDGRVLAVDRTGALPSGTHVLDLGPEVFLMPGLVETHIHLAFDASAQAVASLDSADDEQLLTTMRQAARRVVMSGITTVRDLGDRNFLSLVLAEEFRRAPEQGPEILAAGPPITTRGGHCCFMGGEAEGTQELIAAVRERHERGCAVVKIMASGGNMTVGSDPAASQFSSSQIRTVVDESHRLGMPVAAHAHGTGAIVDAVSAGVDTIEHASFWQQELRQLDQGMLRDLARSGTCFSVTLGFDKRGAEHLPKRLQDHVARVREIMLHLIDAGAEMIVGSDAGIGLAKPHDVLPRAALDLVDFGMSPLRSLQAITSQAARACRVEGRKGRIQAGADADFLAVSGDPLQDLNRLRDVRAVFRSGRRVR